VETALAQFARARQAGPHGLERYVQIVEKIAIAQAYLAREAEALASFGALLVLDPGHVLSYDVSPQATRPFEKARVQARTRPAPGLQVSWPYDLDVATAVPVTVEVVADPARSLARAALHVRRRGQRGWAAIDLELAPPGRHRVVHIPAVGGERPEVVQVYLSAFDRAGNEVLRWAGPEQPRDIALAWDPPPPWYRTWWFWAAAGSVLAAGTGIAVFVIADEPPDLIDGGFSF
jgi:hypothetical protein